jgi:hypothetical protein
MDTIVVSDSHDDGMDILVDSDDEDDNALTPVDADADADLDLDLALYKAYVSAGINETRPNHTSSLACY